MARNYNFTTGALSVALLALTSNGFAAPESQNAEGVTAQGLQAQRSTEGESATNDSSDTTAFVAAIDRELGTAGGLSADDVARRAKATSPALQRNTAQIARAKAEVDRAWAGYLPKLRASAGYTRLSNEASSAGSIVTTPGEPTGPLGSGATLVNAPLSFPTLLSQYTLGATLNVPVSDYFLRVAPTHRAAKASLSSRKADLAGSELRTVGDAKLLYYEWVQARLSVLVAEQALRQVQAHLVDVRQALEVGSASPADALRVESQVASSELLLTSSRNVAVLAEERLRTTMHDTGTTPYAIGEDIRGPAKDEPRPQVAELIRRALEQRPELRALDEERRAQLQRAAAERAGYLPRLDLFADATYANPNERVFPQQEDFRGSWAAGAELSYTFSDIPGAAASVRSATASADSLLADRNAQADQIRIEVIGADQAITEAAISIETTRRGLKSAEESYRVRRLLFQAGKATTVELLDAETELTRARQEALNAAISARVAKVRLDAAVGVKVP